MAKGIQYDDIIPPWDQIKILESKHGWDKAGQMAYEYFNKKYFTPIPDERSSIMKKFKFLIPGRFYSFQYEHPLTEDKLEYFDKQPVMLCFKSYIHPKTGNNLQLGVNLNWIPREMRIFIITGIWKTFAAVIKRDLAGRDPKDKKIVNTQKLLFTDNFDVYGLLDYCLQTIGKTYWSFAIRQYDWEEIVFPKWIDYEDWHKIALLQCKDLHGISEREVAKLYWKQKQEKGK